MPKPRLTKTTEILHLSKTRLRLKVFTNLNELNKIEFLRNLENFSGIEKAKLNSKISTITLQLNEEFKLDKFISYFDKLDFDKFKASDEFLSACECFGSENPSKSQMYLASLALGLNLFSKKSKATKTLSYIACSPILLDGAKDLFEKGLTSRLLEAMAVGVSLARNDFIAANSTNTMLALGEYIEESTVHKSDDLIKELAKPNIEEAWIEVKEKGKVTEIKTLAKDIKVGDIVIVGAGDTIAIDGHIVDGEALVNQVSMTGEAVSVKKSRGDRVMSGTIVEEGRIRVWAEHVGADTATQKIKHYITATLNEKSKIGLKATKLADKLVPITFGLAGVSYAINKSMMNVASVLQADYSCALKLPTPVAFKSSISKAGKNGILIKGAKPLENLASADTFVFDKTGTLTYGNLEVVEVHSFNPKFSEDDLLNLTASAEEHYFHPVAEAIVEAAKERGFVHMHHDEVEFIVAHGVKTHVNKKQVIIGSRHFLEDDEKISFVGFEEKIKKSIKNGLALLYVAYGGELLGTIGMSDRVRENAKDTLVRLKKLGAKELIMLTGDVKEKADEIAKELGIDTVFSGMLPTGKAAILEKLKKDGRKIVFVGDGINDAPSLMQADVGISMHRGADIAKATADISLLVDDICAVGDVKELANKTMDLVERNFNITAAINSAILLGATAGFLSPTATAFLHNGTTIGLLTNSANGVNVFKKKR
ncbi:heavy metal translocating P-type ATPase subfamily protein [Campylobacter geochelonis]|uniref:P-type Zn(2+) transporter n=1 Tax=Campylobacter geochelonis TaxID=1780362 RepID=A0A128ERF3_9BACT|nr:heavy metal translocating P-type ATPase [Campylobacter geochelonis]QKF71731.1 heavy metal translocating P-type ATPase [Campylobacter geochelonis]CZE47634.1 heavy metal translocating P-type ATPase subfamily protein [Campylobacter geochelonis]CZE51150.1 heavy metal translocating P-type ATPase subfamily protein [Campylobacter geochelonis]